MDDMGTVIRSTWLVVVRSFLRGPHCRSAPGHRQWAWRTLKAAPLTMATRTTRTRTTTSPMRRRSRHHRGPSTTKLTRTAAHQPGTDQAPATSWGNSSSDGFNAHEGIDRWKSGETANPVHMGLMGIIDTYGLAGRGSPAW